jgi:hypothetical protein
VDRILKMREHGRFDRGSMSWRLPADDVSTRRVPVLLLLIAICVGGICLAQTATRPQRGLNAAMQSKSASAGQDPLSEERPVILAIDGKPTNDPLDVATALEHDHFGRTMTVTIAFKGHRHNVCVIFEGMN